MADSTKDILKELLGELQRQNDRQEKKDQEDAENNDKNLSTLDKAAKNLRKSIPSVESAVTKGSQMVEAAIKKSFELQKTGLSRGLNLNKIVERQAQSNNDLAGKLTGFSNMYEIQMEKFAAGIGTNSKEMDKLALFTKLTGGDSKKLLKQMGQLNMGVGMSTEQSDKLSRTVMSMSQNYQMTTEELMGTIQGLEKSMPMFKILGIAPEIAEATAKLGAALGQEAGTMASDIMTAFTSAEGAILASQLGVMNERNALLNKEGDTTRTSLRMVEAAGAEASRMYESYLAGTGDPAIAYQAVEDALGPAMAKSALTYKQLEAQAKEQGKSVSQFMREVEKENKIKAEFNNTLDNFFSTVFAPLEYVMTKLVQAFTVVGNFLLNTPVLRQITQALVSLTAAVIALKAVMALRAGAKAVSNLASGAASASPASGAAGGGIGKAMVGIGRGIRSLGSGIGKGIGGLLSGIAKGIAAFGTPKVFKGILALGLVGIAMMPFGKALKMMKGIGFQEIIMLGTSMFIFGTLMAATGFLLGGALPFLIMGAVVFAMVGAALIPLAFALNLAGPPMVQFGRALKMLSDVSVLNILLLGPALFALSSGLMALTAGSIIGGIANFFMGDNNPIDKLIKLGGAAQHINRLAGSLYALSPALASVGAGLKKLDAKDVDKLKDIGSAGYSYKGTFNPATKEFTGTSEGVDQYDVNRARAGIADRKQRIAKAEAAGGRTYGQERMLRMQERELEILEAILNGSDTRTEQQERAARMQAEIRDSMENNSPLQQTPAGGR